MNPNNQHFTLWAGMDKQLCFDSHSELLAALLIPAFGSTRKRRKSKPKTKPRQYYSFLYVHITLSTTKCIIGIGMWFHHVSGINVVELNN